MNSASISARPIEFYKSLPKVELHRHLEGSLRFETVRELARSQGMNLPGTSQLRGMVQVQDSEPMTFENFLSKFSTLRLFYRSEEIIKRVTQEAIADAAADNVRYLELRFTPVALSKAQGFPLGQVMDWVIEGAHQAEKTYGVTTRLIASVNRHEGTTIAAQVSYLALERINDGIVGLDLAGYEPGFPAEPYGLIFASAKEKGLHITVHAAEWDSGDNIIVALEKLGAERIGHGIRILDTPEAVEMARQRNTAFEVCVTSNYQSGAVVQLKDHPIKKMIEQRLNVTINTDDPSISQITLSDEYRLLCETFGFPLDVLRDRVLSAARAAFLPGYEREKLLLDLGEEFHSLIR